MRLTDAVAQADAPCCTRADGVTLYVWCAADRTGGTLSIYGAGPRDLPGLPLTDPAGRTLWYQLTDLDARAAALGFTDWQVS